MPEKNNQAAWFLLGTFAAWKGIQWAERSVWISLVIAGVYVGKYLL